MPLDIIAPRMNELKGERDQIAAERKGMEQGPDVITLHTAAFKRYKRAVADLAGALATDKALVANRPKSRTDPYACFCGHRDRTAKHGSLSSGSKRATGRALRPDSLRLLSTPCSASLTMLDGEVGSTRVAMALRLSLRLPDVILSREQKLLRRWALEQPPA
jgi:hypothetical protein